MKRKIKRILAGLDQISDIKLNSINIQLFENVCVNVKVIEQTLKQSNKIHIRYIITIFLCHF